ncbi:MAG TPA: helical backbone metal receptor [Bacteroidia bacterium]|nr:helical backbone metal receptor [Bacteroidia bacterium]
MRQTVTDQLKRNITIENRDAGIVSLVPSLTELLFDLGLGDKVTGVTKFCTHPPQAKKQCKIIGGTKTPDPDAIRALHPGLIVANKEENNPETVTALEKDFPVWVSDVTNLESALEMIRQISTITGTDKSGLSLADEISNAFAGLPPSPPLRALYLIWKDPYMAAGADTFISDMMKHAGFKNVIHENRYPEVGSKNLFPEVVLLSSEPYPFSEKHIEEVNSMYPEAVVVPVDGTYFSWYGSRMRYAPQYFTAVRKLITRRSGITGKAG